MSSDFGCGLVFDLIGFWFVQACDKVIHVLYLTNDVLFSIQHHPAADIFKAE